MTLGNCNHTRLLCGRGFDTWKQICYVDVDLLHGRRIATWARHFYADAELLHGREVAMWTRICYVDAVLLCDTHEYYCWWAVLIDLLSS